MKLSSLTIIWSTGIAIFSMFFGSGNVVFPLLLGQEVGQQVPWALLGMLVTAVGAPLLGLLASVLFEGNCKQFFYRIGTVPGYLAVLLLLAILGPLGVIPRCFVVAYGAITPYFEHFPLWAFSLIGGVITFLGIVRRDLILPLLGFWLSPLLVLSLLVIIVMALIHPEPLLSTSLTPTTAALRGLLVGYNTMDLLASILFSVSIWMLLKDELKLNSLEATSQKKLVRVYIWASIIGGCLLGLVYLGLSLSTAFHAQAISGIAPERILSHLAIHILGEKLSIVANIAVLLACFTTIMSLAVAVVDVIHVELAQTKLATHALLSYNKMMFLTVITSVILSNLGFERIMAILGPLVQACYPAMIVLALCNILFKLYGFKWVKLPVYGTLAMTVAWMLFNG